MELEGEVGERKLFLDDFDDIGLGPESAQGSSPPRGWGPPRPISHQVEHAGRVGLVLGTLGEEEETLARLRCVGDVVVGDGGLLGLEVFGQGLLLDGLIAVPEELLGEAEAPRWPSALGAKPWRGSVEAYLIMPGPLYPKTPSLTGAASVALALSLSACWPSAACGASAGATASGAGSPEAAAGASGWVSGCRASAPAPFGGGEGAKGARGRPQRPWWRCRRQRVRPRERPWSGRRTCFPRMVDGRDESEKRLGKSSNKAPFSRATGRQKDSLRARACSGSLRMQARSRQVLVKPGREQRIAGCGGRVGERKRSVRKRVGFWFHTPPKWCKRSSARTTGTSLAAAVLPSSFNFKVAAAAPGTGHC
jgi:hypothetical protein